jgi:hypothetical protein
MVQRSSSKSPFGDKDRRISIGRCRELLGPESPEEDTHVEAFRDCMYALANIVIDEYVKKCGERERVDMGSAPCYPAFSPKEMTH